MDNEELAKWMEQHQIGEQLLAWVTNDLLGHRAYGILEDLATEGKAVILISIDKDGRIHLQKVEETVKIKSIQETQVVAEPATETIESTETPEFVPKKIRKREY
jgi:hypothetical protein